MKILVIKTAALGDVLRTTAILPGLRRAFPSATITWITGDGARPLLEGSPDIDEVIEQGAVRDTTSLADRVFDWVISLEEDAASATLASRVRSLHLSGVFLEADGQVRYTDDLAPWFGMGLLRPVELGGLEEANRLKRENRSTHVSLLYDCLGLPGPPGKPYIRARADDVDRVHEWFCFQFPRGPRIIGFNPGAGGRWQHKKLSEPRSVEIARYLLREFPVRILLLGGPAEAEMMGRLLRHLPENAIGVLPWLPSIGEFIALIGHCDVLLSTDSLALHIGIALEIPTIAVFGPTSAAEIEVYGLGAKVQTSLPCAVCYRSTCDISPNCMEVITEGQIAAAMRPWI